MNADYGPDLPSTSTRSANRILVDVVRQTPVEIALRRIRRRILFIGLGIILLCLILAVVRRVTRDKPVTYKSDAEHFLYGSIGSEPGGKRLRERA